MGRDIQPPTAMTERHIPVIESDCNKVCASLRQKLVSSNKKIDDIIRAWETLPEGHHSPKKIQEWLINTMGPAINKLRKPNHPQP